MAPGLDRVPRGALAQAIAGLGFNCVRFPFGIWMTRQTSPVADRHLAANPDLYGLTPWQGLRRLQPLMPPRTGPGIS